jgi:glutaredoxin
MILSWLFSGRPRLEHLHILVYTRRGCHLCDDAWQLLEREQRQYGFRLTAIDVDSDPELAGRYGECVPVVLVDGRVRFRGIVNRALLTRLLRMAR